MGKLSTILITIILFIGIIVFAILSNNEDKPQEEEKQHSLSAGTYVPEDIEVSTNTEGRGAVSFTHIDGMHYVLYFNED